MYPKTAIKLMMSTKYSRCNSCSLNKTNVETEPLINCVAIYIIWQNTHTVANICKVTMREVGSIVGESPRVKKEVRERLKKKSVSVYGNKWGDQQRSSVHRKCERENKKGHFYNMRISHLLCADKIL